MGVAHTNDFFFWYFFSLATMYYLWWSPIFIEQPASFKKGLFNSSKPVYNFFCPLKGKKKLCMGYAAVWFLNAELNVLLFFDILDEI